MGFIYAGRLDELKGIKIMLQAWNMMGSDAPELTICGTGPLENWCREYVTENCLNTVEILGFVPNDEVKKKIAQSTALILPTQWYEGFPMVVLEAYSVGTPVICSDLGNVGSVVEDGVTGYKFKFDEPESLIKAVGFLINNPNICISTIDLFREKYTVEENYRRLMEIYEFVS